MAKSLADQLRKAGLVSDHKARQATAEKRKKKKQARAGAAEDEDAKRREEVARAAREKAEHDRELNRQRQAEAEARALAAQIKQIIDMNLVERGAEDMPFSYQHEDRVKTLMLGTAEREALVKGRLALVDDDGSHVLLPAGAARKIADRDAQRILVLNTPEAADDSDTPEEDDPYAAFEVPDDLMW